MMRSIRTVKVCYVAVVLAGALLCPASDDVVSGGDSPAPVLKLEPQCGMPFQDNAVLQQKTYLPVWGSTLPGAKVTVVFDNQKKTVVADMEGRWRVMLDPMDAVKLKSVNDEPEGMVMIITCEKDGEKAVKEIANMLVGEVWLCSGQSNMAGKMRSGRITYPPDSGAVMNYPALRQMVSPAEGPWLVCTPEMVAEFKRVAFFFAIRMQWDVLVPVGLINAAVGGSSIESWLNREPYGVGQNYAKMIAPLEGYGIRGLLWYQGESNAKDGRGYAPKLTSLINGWRDAWGQKDSVLADGPRRDFSTYFVQLPGIGISSTDNPAGGDGRAEIRQAQFDVLAVTNTGMAVTIDVGDIKEHPPNKYDTGMRLAHLALNNDYGFKEAALSPLYKKHSIDGAKIRISFDNAENGLMIAVKENRLPPKHVPDARLDWLSVQDKDGKWYWAEGLIDGSELIVSCGEVQDPVAVRYAYTVHPKGNLLYSKEGMPVGPFSTSGYDAKTDDGD